MQIDRLRKIEQLVRETSLLSPPEKEEWLNLVDLMSDRQLLELERILAEPPSREERPAVFRPAPAQPAAPLRSAPPLSRPSSQAFSHILNFPQGSPEQNHKSKDKVPPAPKVATKPQPFAQQLKQVLAEKELPPGRQEARQQLTKNGFEPAAAPPVKLSPPKPAPVIAKIPDKQPTPTSQPKPAAVVNLNVNAEPQSDNLTKPVSVSLKNLVASGADGRQDRDVTLNIFLRERQTAAHAVPASGDGQGKAPDPTPAALGELAEAAAASRPPGLSVATTAPAPGLNFPEMSESELQGNLAAASLQQRVMAQTTPAAKIILREKPGDAMEIQTLAQLAALQIADFRSHAPAALHHALRSLASKFGFHDVMFNLQKSPLYQAYLQAGTRLLKEAQGDRPGQNQLLAPSMERVEFEEFTDLLIVFQAS